MSEQAAQLERTSQRAAPQHEPPFRAEHIGSLLRPKELLEARGKFARGEITQSELTAAEDTAILEAIALQKQLGLRFVTDGEFRRRSYHSFFYRQLGDITIDVVGGEPIAGADNNEAGKRGAQPLALIKSRVQWTHPINVDDYRFLAANSDLMPKITIPGPCALHFRGGDRAVKAHAYRDMDTFWSDTVEAFTKELNALAAAGCRYIQIDETAFAKFGDPEVQATLAARGDDWNALIDTYIDVTNQVLRAAPKSLRIGMHLCRGNRGGQWHAQGSYDSVADRLFNALDIPFYFLEYDTPRAGTFTPLRFVPRHKMVILGLISSKLPVIEHRDTVRTRIDDAVRFIDLDRLAISPQCGFASVDTGNPVTPKIQSEKLQLVVDVAKEIWGTA
ncbi:5-methyltetrahydropteroyltriglutamate--homocysteine S-methyltransferase [Pseudorhodoplanes sinuspersici]|uniref:5-methyltetrahydropteroyltriglutamate-- homocysteine S-methyltransferase n=1 Tax=Pseudorhodoplanes sinuspersici TaxID=1235591 RepID=UPI000FF2DB06|nr:5-methyltetrahydropteroyltriglutamate--homocysteine S-methyltransferase [Pseudorhodoplanes sinuspersici]RKE67566.1 5-methyltetrahydropteroyltriglutamate--homocysteine methyltransferase [Pseudorhodoplanes sinuspersici]